jgi:hypothetical protein
LLEKFACPVPFHEVRTRFLGQIATPAGSAAPLRIIEGLWGGELPEFASLDEVNELMQGLLHGLWNDLTRHQKRSQPFRLTRVPQEVTAANLGQYGRVRLEELDGFIGGLFNGREVIELPERAHIAIEHLCELRAMMAGICELVSRDPEVEEPALLEVTFKQLRKLTRIMETEINEAVLSCARARYQALQAVPTNNPTVH